MVIVRFTKAAAGDTSLTHLNGSLWGPDKGVKTQIGAPQEKHHSSLRDSSGLVFSVKDAINQPISPAPADLIYMFARGHQSPPSEGMFPKRSEASEPPRSSTQPKAARRFTQSSR